MKYYVELPCDNMEIISSGIYNFLKTVPGLLSTTKFGWHFVDCKQLLASVPELIDFFKKNSLLPRHAAITIIEDNTHLPKHIDELPVIAKINLPVLNTKGWANRWYVDNQLVAELVDMNRPIVFNSQILHSVEKITAVDLPRIIASFTFHNEPLHLLT